MIKYKQGQYVYIIENNRWVRKATVISYSGGFYTLGIIEGGLTRLRENRIYRSEEEANEVIPHTRPVVSTTPAPITTGRTHHFYT